MTDRHTSEKAEENALPKRMAWQVGDTFDEMSPPRVVFFLRRLLCKRCFTTTFVRTSPVRFDPEGCPPKVEDWHGKRGVKIRKKNGETKRNGFLNNDFPSKAVLCALGP